MNSIAEPIEATPWLSVLVPAYNAAAYLGECVESVLAQGIEGVELVVVDDCSNDASAAILTQLATRWPKGFRVQRFERSLRDGFGWWRTAFACNAMRATGD